MEMAIDIWREIERTNQREKTIEHIRGGNRGGNRDMKQNGMIVTFDIKHCLSNISKFSSKVKFANFLVNNIMVK